MNAMNSHVFDPIHALVLLGGTAAATALLIQLLHPLLVRYAMARPTARSSHTIPTPQGGGIPIVITVLAVVIAGAALGTGPRPASAIAMVIALATLAMAGAIDDIHPLPVLPRLIAQLSAAALLVLTFPNDARLLPVLDLVVERALLVVGLVWFINLTNFMDGIDWMTVVEMVPVIACLAALGLTGLVSELTPLLPVVLALLGGMLGFAPFNRHVAKLFLGDVGSLPIGALVGWLLIVLALAGHLIAALILPLYYLADATITLIRRWRNGENVSQAHRSHFYQRATSGGFSVPQVTRDVFALNVLLAMLSIAAVRSPLAMQRFACLALAIVATLAILRRFEKGAPEQRT